MSGKKVFELARDFNMKSKELLEIMRSIGIPATTHMSVLDESSISVLRGKLSKQADGASKSSESFKEIKGTPKTILIKKKAAAPSPEELQQASAGHGVSGVEAITGEKSAAEIREDEKKLEENVVRKLKEFRELGGLREDLHAAQASAGPRAQTLSADLEAEPAIEDLMPQI